jgi:hypothetical protein
MTTTIHPPLDHWRLVRRKPAEVERLRRIFSSPEGANDLTVMHDAPSPVVGRCCKREPWPVTLAALWPKGAPKTLWVSDCPEAQP